MKPILFSIGPLNFYGYGFMIAVGILAAIFAAERRAPRYGLNPDKIFWLGFTCSVVGLLGAKILYVITQIPSIMEDPSTALSTITSEGFVVYGGIILGILFAILYCRWQKMEFIRYLDLAVPSIALAQGLGRIGCFLAGCCYGKETDAFWGITFTESSYAPSGVSLIPTQLIMSALDFLNFFILCLFARKSKKSGQVAALYMINYSVGRFLVEFLRDDPRGSIGPLSTSQFISIFVLIIGVLLMVFSSIHWEEEHETVAAKDLGEGWEDVEDDEKEDNDEYEYVYVYEDEDGNEIEEPAEGADASPEGSAEEAAVEAPSAEGPSSEDESAEEPAEEEVAEAPSAEKADVQAERPPEEAVVESPTEASEETVAEMSEEPAEEEKPQQDI